MLLQGLSKWGLKIGEDEDSTAILDKLFQCLTILVVRNCSLYLSGISHDASCIIFYLVSVLCISENSLALSFLWMPIRLLKRAITSQLSIIHAVQIQLVSLTFSVMFSSPQPSWWSSTCLSISLLHSGSQNCIQVLYFRCSFTGAEQSGIIISFDVQAMFLFTQPSLEF